MSGFCWFEIFSLFSVAEGRRAPKLFGIIFSIFDGINVFSTSGVLHVSHIRDKTKRVKPTNPNCVLKNYNVYKRCFFFHPTVLFNTFLAPLVTVLINYFYEYNFFECLMWFISMGAYTHCYHLGSNWSANRITLGSKRKNSYTSTAAMDAWFFA